MTNREKYKNELLDMLGYGIAVDKKTGKPAICEHIKCINCLFYDEQDCSELFKAWLNKEYVEKTVKASSLAIDTKVICWSYENETLKKRYFAKFTDGTLFAFDGGYGSWTTEHCVPWRHMTLEDGTIVLAE